MDCSLPGPGKNTGWPCPPPGIFQTQGMTCTSYISGGVFTPELINFYCYFLFQNTPWSPCFISNIFFLFISCSKNDKKIIENLYHKIYISLYFFHIALLNVSIKDVPNKPKSTYMKICHIIFNRCLTLVFYYQREVEMIWSVVLYTGS